MTKNGSSTDPLKSAVRNAPTLTRAFLLHGEELTIVQRIGVILISSFILAGGVVWALDIVEEIRAGTRPDPFWLLRTILALLMGIGGLINGFRFKRK